ncbi:MAG: hypothetical protein ACR2JH_09630 [Solirubrobacteraceae bacterium]
MTATLAVGLAIAASPALAQPLTPAPPVVLDGPSPNLVELDGMSIAADGTGGLVYLKTVSGIAHVFVSSLTGGAFRPAQQVDAGLAGASSQPVIVAGTGGVLQIAFINGGALWVVDRLAASSAFPAPYALARGAANPSLQRTKLGKAYLAFTAADGGGFDVRTAFFYAGRWALEPAPLNAVPADNAGTGAGRPQVAAAGDGIAIVVWGEQGHIYVRRVSGIAPSVALQQADVPALSGWSEVSSAEPVVGSGGDSTYANVVFREVLTNGAQTQERVLMNRLHASVFDGVTLPDGLSTPGPEGAYQPATSDSEYAIGFVTSAHDISNQLWGTVLNGRPVGTLRIDSLPNASPPYGTSAMDGLYSGLVAWQHDPGSPGAAEVRARRYDSGSFGPEMVLSSPTTGPTDAARGITTAGDGSGDAAVAWVQDAAGGAAIVTDQLYEPPGSFGPASSHQYARTLRPRLSWSPAKSFWGVTYRVSLDGGQIAQTTATSATVPVPLAQGPHRWQVTATNAAGVSSTSPMATVFVDTVPPTGRLKLSGTKHAQSLLHATVIAADVPTGLPPSNGSGVAALYISWGDHHHVYRIRHGMFHTYARPGRYTVKVTIVDRAGNVATIVSHLHITPKPQPPASRHLRHSTRRTVAQPAVPILT